MEFSLAAVAARKYMNRSSTPFSSLLAALPFARSNSSSDSDVFDSLPDMNPAAGAGRYANWADVPEAGFVKRRHMFATLDDVMSFVEEHQFAPFYVHTVRINIVAAARAMRTVAPFGEHQRFPDNAEFVDLDHPKVCGPLTQLLNACELPDRQMNVSGSSHPNGSLNDAKRAFDSAFALLRALVKDVRYDQMARNGIYCRASFEATYGLNWQN